MKKPARIAILASGQGSTMEALAEAIDRGELPAQICLVLSNEPNAPVLSKARARGLKTCCLDHRDFEDRAHFEVAMRSQLDVERPDFIVLAGFMRILTNSFVREYYGSLLNIHPSLLPKYPGLNTHQRALDAGDPKAGSTVHFVTPELDAGPIILQASVPIHAGDTAAVLAQRVQTQEHCIYPKALRWCIEGRIELRDGRAVTNGATTSDSSHEQLRKPQDSATEV